MGVVNLPIVVDRIRALLEGLGGVGVGAEEASGVVSDPAVEDEEPPVALVEEPLDLDVVLGAADGGEGREGYAGVDGGVDLDPAGYVAVPAALVVGGGGVAVGGVVDEEVGGGDLVGVVDPVAKVRWWVVGLGAEGTYHPASTVCMHTRLGSLYKGFLTLYLMTAVWRREKSAFDWV